MDTINSSLKRFSLSNVSNLADQATRFVSNISNTFSTRHAIVRRLIEHNGHQFEATFLPEPTKCSHCNKFFCFPHGQRCKLCKLICHMKCLSMISARCVKGKRSGEEVECHRPNSEQLHQLKSSILVLSPTLCDHCGTFIMVWHKYHKCSSCSRIYHHECAELVAKECRPRLQAGLTPQYTNTSRMTIDQFDVLGLLGTGSFSKVYLVRRRIDEKDELYAIKVIKKTNPVVNGDPGGVFNEWQSLQLGRSYPFLTIGHCCFQSRDRLFFVMEYVQGKDLLYYVNEQGAFSEDRVRFHSAEIVLALMYMHKNDIVYRDLKLNNVILDQYGHCKLIDFGMSKKLHAKNQMKTNTFCGTVFYLSPEILKGEPYGCSVDWWSLGVLMYEMLCDRLPFNGHKDDEVFEAIMTRSVTYPDNFKISDKAISILDGLLTKDPRRRLGCDLMEDYATAIKKHPFFLQQDADGKPSSDWWLDIEAMRIKPPYVPTQSGNGRVYYPERIDLTPTSSSQFDEIPQSCFDNFSQYSESFMDSGRF